MKRNVSEREEKYFLVLAEIFKSFTSERAPLKIKIMLALIAIAISVLITLLKRLLN